MIVTTPLSAQDTKAFRFGGSLGFVNPIGDLSDIASVGFASSVFVQKPFTDFFSIRAGVDSMFFGKKYYIDRTIKLGLSADVILSLAGQDTGPFSIVTVGFQTYSFQVDGYALDRPSGTSYGAGFGYNFNRNWGVEIKYIVGTADGDWIRYNTGYFQVSIPCRL